MCLSVIDVKILKTYNNVIENVLEIIDDLKSNIVDTISFEKVVREGDAN